MQQFWGKRKNRLLFLVILIASGALIYIFLQTPIREKFPPLYPVVKEKVNESLVQESKMPVSQIASPQAGSFQRGDFFVKVYDVDVGGSGLDSAQCLYSVYDCGVIPCEPRVVNRARACGDAFSVSVGQGKDCASEGENACRVVVKSQDSAGNSNTLSESVESIRSFGIDITPPRVAGQTLPKAIRNLARTFSGRVSDNGEVANCDVLINGEIGYAGDFFDFSETSCDSDAEHTCYTMFASHAFSKEGTYQTQIACWDLAGNFGFSTPQEIDVFLNRPPAISSCRLMPAQGSTKTQFVFEVQASDPDGDPLSYQWDFGDGISDSRKDPPHVYEKKGTYRPQVIVSDGNGGKETCSTAWALVDEDAIIRYNQ